MLRQEDLPAFGNGFENFGCIKFGRLSLRNSEPASAGDISIAMGWSSTVRVGVDRKADEAPSRAKPLVRTKNILEPVEWVTEALAVMTSNDFLSPGSRPSPWQAVTRYHGFQYLYLLNEWFRC